MKDQAPVVHADEISSPSLDSLAAAFGAAPSDLAVPETPVFPQAWAKYVRTSPKDFYNRLTRDLPFRTVLSFNINIDGTGYINFAVKDGAREVASANRCFSVQAQTAGNHGVQRGPIIFRQNGGPGCRG